MKGNEKVIMYLNRLLKDELIAVNQYCLHSKIFKHWGLKRLHKIENQEFIDELKHAELYMDRILFLEGSPYIKGFDELGIGKNIEDIFLLDQQLEYNSINNLKESIKFADSVQDYISQGIMIKILGEEEKHIDFLEIELNLIKKMGIHNYMQLQISE